MAFVKTTAELLLVAVKLQHYVLFRECYTYVIANFMTGFYKEADQKRIKENAQLHLLVLQGQNRLNNEIQKAIDLVVLELLNADSLSRKAAPHVFAMHLLWKLGGVLSWRLLLEDEHQHTEFSVNTSKRILRNALILTRT